MLTNSPHLAYSIDEFSKVSGVGRTSLFTAIKAGELRTITPVVNGKTLKRRLITLDEGRRWIATFPASDDAA